MKIIKLVGLTFQIQYDVGKMQDMQVLLYSALFCLLKTIACSFFRIMTPYVHMSFGTCITISDENDTP